MKQPRILSPGWSWQRSVPSRLWLRLTFIGGVLPAAIGAAVQYVFPGDGIKVPPLTGLCVATPVAVILMASDFTFVFNE